MCFRKLNRAMEIQQAWFLQISHAASKAASRSSNKNKQQGAWLAQAWSSQLSGHSVAFAKLLPRCVVRIVGSSDTLSLQVLSIDWWSYLCVCVRVHVRACLVSDVILIFGAKVFATWWWTWQQLADCNCLQQRRCVVAHFGIREQLLAEWSDSATCTQGLFVMLAKFALCVSAYKVREHSSCEMWCNSSCQAGLLLLQTLQALHNREICRMRPLMS